MTSSTFSKLWYLSQFKLFSELTAPEMEEMERITVMKEIPKSQAIYLPGDLANTVYLLKKGRVRILRLSDEGKEGVMAILGPGDIFGELALLDDNEPRNEIAEAIEDSFICLVDKKDLEQLLLKKPRLNLGITKLMGLRLRKIENQIDNLLFKSTPQRLEDLLQRLAGEYGVSHPEGTLINLRLTHQDLGNLVNATRQTISECITALKQDKKIKINGHKIILLNLIPIL